MTTRPTLTHSQNKKEATGIDRLYKRVGVRKVSFYYQYSNGESETLATAPVGDSKAILEASNKAKRLALDINQGQVIAGSVADMIERFTSDVAPTHFRDQSRDGIAVRKSTYQNLVKFFGKMQPASLRTVHGYQYLDARARSGAPAKANKEMALFSTICHYAVRWGVIEANPFVGMMQNKTDRVVRTTTRSQIVRFYLWSLHQSKTIRNAGCAAMFAYLTGFRPSEVRPFHISGLKKDGVHVINAKRKKGEIEISKIREWSPRLRAVVARAKQTHGTPRLFLFANQTGSAYTRSGWGAIWSDAMWQWIASFDDEAAKALSIKKIEDANYKTEYDKGLKQSKKVEESDFDLTMHPAYFSLQNVRPAAITTKLRNRDADAYDFAAHANPSTTHTHYDRRKVKKASATE
jgi:integrase